MSSMSVAIGSHRAAHHMAVLLVFYIRNAISVISQMIVPSSVTQSCLANRTSTILRANGCAVGKGKRTKSGGRPGSQEALPPPSPLRTVQDTFASYGSGTSNAPVWTRWPHGIIESNPVGLVW